MTPPELFDAAASVGEKPSCCAVTCCKLPNNTFEDVSLPVSATPSQPRIGEKNGNKKPVLANASPIVASSPAKRVVNPSASIAAIVSNDQRTRQNVRPKMRRSRAGLNPSSRPETIPDSSNPVPVAESQFNTKIASSAFGCGTTGGARKTILSRPGTGISMTEILLRKVLTCGSPHRKTSNERTIHGIHAMKASRREYLRSGSTDCGRVSCAPSSSWAKRQVVRGCQNLSSNTMERIEAIAPAMSTTQGP